MNNYNWVAISIIAVFMLSGASAQESDILLESPAKSSASKLSLDELRSGVKARYDAIRAIDVNYKIGSVTQGDLTEYEIRFAWAGEKRLRQMEDYVLATQGDFEEAFLPEFKEVSVRAEKQPIIDQDPFMQAMGFPLTDTERASVNDTDFLLPYSLFDPRLEWTVLPELEIVDGADCHVVRANTAQRIWIDVDSQFAVRLRQLHFRVKDAPSDEWPIGIQYRFSDFVNVEGLPMPYKCEMVTCATPSQPKSLWGKPQRSSVITVSEMSLNESVNDDIFSLSYPPGTEVRDPVHNRYYRLGDDGKELALLVAVSEKKLNDGLGGSRLLFVTLNAILFGVLVAVFAVGKFKANKND